MKENGTALKLVNWITEKAVEGIPPMSPAASLALEYQIDRRYQSDDERIAALINYEARKSFTAGFITGLGGLLTLPLAIPSALAATWVLQARMAGAIAAIRGHDPKTPQVRTLILLSLVGESAEGVLKDMDVKLGQKAAITALTRLPGRVLIAINRRVGLRLMSRLGGRGALTLSRALPLFGGVISGGFDAYACRKTGEAAKALFSTRTSKSRKPPKSKSTITAT
jgi:hypothetical protein